MPTLHLALTCDYACGGYFFFVCLRTPAFRPDVMLPGCSSVTTLLREGRFHAVADCSLCIRSVVVDICAVSGSLLQLPFESHSTTRRRLYTP